MKLNIKSSFPGVRDYVIMIWGNLENRQGSLGRKVVKEKDRESTKKEYNQEERERFSTTAEVSGLGKHAEYLFEFYESKDGIADEAVVGAIIVDTNNCHDGETILYGL